MLHDLCDALALSTPVLPYLSPSLPQPDWPSVASMHSHCLRHSCPTLGLSDPPQYPYKFCLNVTFPRDYPSPSPFRSHHHHHPSPPGPLTVVLSPSTFQLSFLSPRSGLKSYLHVHLFMSLYT